MREIHHSDEMQGDWKAPVSPPSEGAKKPRPRAEMPLGENVAAGAKMPAESLAEQIGEHAAEEKGNRTQPV